MVEKNGGICILQIVQYINLWPFTIEIIADHIISSTLVSSVEVDRIGI